MVINSYYLLIELRNNRWVLTVFWVDFSVLTFIIIPHRLYIFLSFLQYFRKTTNVLVNYNNMYYVLLI